MWARQKFAAFSSNGGGRFQWTPGPARRSQARRLGGGGKAARPLAESLTCLIESTVAVAKTVHVNVHVHAHAHVVRCEVRRLLGATLRARPTSRTYGLQLLEPHTAARGILTYLWERSHQNRAD